MSFNSPLTWLRGGIGGDQGAQSLNFGLSPWMQPRLDTSMLGLQPDIYQVMAAAALQETGSLDPSKMNNPSLLQFQQNIPNVSAPLMQNPMLQQSHSQQNFLQNFQESNLISQAQMLQQKLQQEHVKQPQQLHPQFQDQQTNKITPTGPQIGSSSASESRYTPLQAFSSTNQLQNFSDLIGDHMTSSNNNPPMQSLLSSFSQEGAPHLVNLHGHSSVASHSSSSKRIALDPQLPSKISQFGVPHPEELVNSKVSGLPGLMPQFMSRDFSDFQGVSDPHNNQVMMGVNADSSGIMQNGLSSIRHNSGTENDSLSLSYGTPAFSSAPGSSFPLNSDMTSSTCLDESGYLQSSENGDQTNPNPGTFVKVRKLVFFSQLYYLT